MAEELELPGFHVNEQVAADDVFNRELKTLDGGAMVWQITFKLSLISLVAFFSGPLSIADEPEIKSEKQLIAFAKQHFSKLKGFQTGDLITTGDVKPLLNTLAQQGWTVPQANELMSRLIATGSYLDRTLSTRNGQKFFREISRIPGGIDRVERMSKLKNGQGSVSQLVNFPNGSDMIRDLATTKAGNNLGRYASKRSDGRNFNKSTGKIYTEQALVTELVKQFRNDPNRKDK